MRYDFDYGFAPWHIVSTVVSGFVAFLLFAITLTLAFLLVRFLLVATRAAKIYVAKHEPEQPLPDASAYTPAPNPSNTPPEPAAQPAPAETPPAAQSGQTPVDPPAAMPASAKPVNPPKKKPAPTKADATPPTKPPRAPKSPPATPPETPAG